MRIKTSKFVTVMLCLSVFQTSQKATAQTVGWELPPSDYTNIVRFGPELYQVTDHRGKVGLIRPDGTVVVPVEADKIGRFCEGIALVTREESPNRHCILGTLKENGTYTAFNDRYYTLKGQDFYSNGLLSVENTKKEKGYINVLGTPAWEFEKYRIITPFTEGYAAVSKEHHYYLINESGRRQDLKLDLGNLSVIFNPVHGKSLAMDDYRKFYVFTLGEGDGKPLELKANDCKELGLKWKQVPSTDYLFRPECIVKHCGMDIFKDAPFTKLPAGYVGLAPTKYVKGYGFEKDGNIILPGQLTGATTFEDNLSIVSVNGRIGLLRYYEDQQPFSISMPHELYNFNAGDSVACRFTLNVPQVWNKKKLSVNVRAKEDESDVHPTANGQEYTISIQPRHSGLKEYNVSVSSEGLQLWRGLLSFMLKRNVVPLQLSGLQLDDSMTDINYKVSGSFIIYNPNEEEVETELTFSHSDHVISIGGCPKKVVVKPGEHKRLPFFIVVSYKFEICDVSITVASSRGGRDSISREIVPL